MSTPEPATEPTTTNTGTGGAGPGVGVGQVVGALEAIDAAVTVLVGVDPHVLPGQVLLQVVQGLEVTDRRLSAVRAALLAAAETEGLWALEGARSFPAWVRTHTQASPAKAGALTRTARALRDHLPATAAALAAGTISTEHAATVAKHTTTTPARRTALSDPVVGEEFLIAQARTLDAADFTHLIRHWAITADPDAADRTWTQDLAKEELVLAKTTDGYHLQGWLTPVHGTALDTALRAQSGTPTPGDQRTTTQRRANALNNLIRLVLDSGTLTPHAATPAHLNIHVPYDTLTRLTHTTTSGTTTGSASTGFGGTAAAAGGGGPRFGRLRRQGNPPTTSCEPAAPAAPAASATPTTPTDPTDTTGSKGLNGSTGSTGLKESKRVKGAAGSGGARGDHEPTAGLIIPADLDYDALRGAPPAELDDGTPLPHSLLAALACDSHLSRVIFGPNSEILDAGRTKRLFTPAQRRAIIARDGHCQYPGCNAPPHQGQIHHSIWWYAQHGTTRANDGILLCWHHHDHVHAHGITIERTTTDTSTGTSSTTGLSTTGTSTTDTSSTSSTETGTGSPTGTAGPNPTTPAPHTLWRFTRRNGNQIHDPRTTTPHQPWQLHA